MKKIALLTLGLVLSLCVSGCDDDEPVVNSSSQGNPSSQEEQNGWTDEEKALMQQYLHGEILPYINIPGNNSLVYSNEYEELVLKGGIAVGDELEQYATSFTQAGFSGGSQYDGYYFFEKVVTTNEGDRHIEVYFFCEVDDLENPGYTKYSETGAFYLYACDPYEYAWPENQLSLLAQSFETTDPIPGFEANRYSVNLNEEVGGGYIVCYEIDNDPTQVYEQTLISNGYTIDSEKDYFGYFVSYSENEEIEIDYAYDGEEDYFTIFVYFIDYVRTTTSFPAEQIKEWLERLNINASVPSIECDGNYNLIIYYEEDGDGYEDNFYFDVDEDILDNYLDILEAANWDIHYDDEEDYYYCYDPTEQLYLELYLYEDETGIYTVFDLYPNDFDSDYEISEAFPTSAISEWLEEINIEASVPTFYVNGPYFYKSSIQENNNSFEVLVKADGMNAFKGILHSNNWTSHYNEGDDYYFGSDSTGQLFYLLNYEDGYTRFVLMVASEVGYDEDDYTDKVDDKLTFDFSSEAQLTKKDASESIWTNGTNKMTVTKGDAQIDVGNGSYFSNPLRLYNGQVVTFSWEEEAPKTITIECDLSNSKSETILLTGGALTGCTASANGNVITITVTGTSSCSINLTGGAKQLWFKNATFNY